ncbi:hypothetical protein Cgig2_007144 [Carnegiea gigantea]|uniref:Uncharacterized protein n=1 Tax=Carnegiea gigantea TaxID=171969 RepID=A0A9Q1KMU0_9CARY|nr:hypothetical protein Cgig2_007144 [Carnegiea gigantea]
MNCLLKLSRKKASIGLFLRLECLRQRRTEQEAWRSSWRSCNNRPRTRARAGVWGTDSRETRSQQPTNTLVSLAQPQPSSEEHGMRGPAQQQPNSQAEGAPSVSSPEDRGSIHSSPASNKPTSTVGCGSYGPSNDKPQPSYEDPESSPPTQASSSSPQDMGTSPLVAARPE